MNSIDKFHNDKNYRDKLVYNILKKFTKEKHPEMKEYRWDDGFYVFANDEEGAEKKHQEWLEKNKK